MEENQNQKKDEIEELEEEVQSMAQKISECRETLPIQLTNTLNSILSTQRPTNFTRFDANSDSDNPNLDARTPIDTERRVEILDEKNPTHIENVEMIKQKISCNAATEVLLVKRMKDIMSRIDKLDSFNHDMIHTAFTKKRRT